MTSTPEAKARRHEGLVRFVRSQRDIADEAARQFGADDPLHHFTRRGQGQPFRDVFDFINRCARPLVENDGEDETLTQELMALYRLESPYYIAACLVILANRLAEVTPGVTSGADEDGRPCPAEDGTRHCWHWQDRSRCCFCGDVDGPNECPAAVTP